MLAVAVASHVVLQIAVEVGAAVTPAMAVIPALLAVVVVVRWATVLPLLPVLAATILVAERVHVAVVVVVALALMLLVLVWRVVVWASWVKALVALVVPPIRPDLVGLAEQTAASAVVVAHMAEAVAEALPLVAPPTPAELPVEKALYVSSGPVLHVHSHQPIQGTCKWNYLFALQMA
jgi:hypothetical protein